MKIKLIVLSALVVFAVTVFPCEVDKDKGAQLLIQFLPQEVVDDFSENGHSELLEPSTVRYELGYFKEPLDHAVHELGPQSNYVDFTLPNDSKCYVFLFWMLGPSVYWRLVSSQSDGQFALVQDCEGWYETTQMNIAQFWFSDLDNDAFPELLLCSGEKRKMTALYVFKFQNGKLVRITPDTSIDQWGYPLPNGYVGTPMIQSINGSGIYLEDLDSDKKAEIIVGPDREEEWLDEAHEENRIWHSTTPTRVYHLVNGVYVYWKDLSAGDQYPIAVPSSAVFHPGTIPFSELSSPGKGEIGVFICHPPGDASVDDVNTGTLNYKTFPLTFKKRWPNQKQPDITSANWSFESCPVKRVPADKKGEWNPSPEDPYFPSPDNITEFHFVGPYLEFRISRSVIFPYLVEMAKAAFNKEPERTEYFISVPISGKMKNDKLLSVSAFVCIKKTGNQELKGDDKQKKVDEQKKIEPKQSEKK